MQLDIRENLKHVWVELGREACQNTLGLKSYFYEAVGKNRLKSNSLNGAFITLITPSFLANLSMEEQNFVCKLMFLCMHNFLDFDNLIVNTEMALSHFQVPKSGVG